MQEKFPELLEGDSVKWNFTKFLINRQGEVAGRYEPTTSPLAMKADIEKLLYEMAENSTADNTSVTNFEWA